MIKINGNLGNKVYLACSGGVDSMAILDFLRKGNKEVVVCYFDHGTKHSHEVFLKLKDYCYKEKIGMICGKSSREKDSGESLEEYWRNIRYDFLHSIDGDVITCHHLDDVVETYLFTTFHGMTKLISYRNRNVIRPFLETRKKDFIKWCLDKNVPYWDDESNKDTRFARNRIRHNIMPEVIKVNPGIHKVVRKLLEQGEKIKKKDWIPSISNGRIISKEELSDRRRGW